MSSERSTSWRLERRCAYRLTLPTGEPAELATDEVLAIAGDGAWSLTVEVPAAGAAASFAGPDHVGLQACTPELVAFLLECAGEVGREETPAA